MGGQKALSLLVISLLACHDPSGPGRPKGADSRGDTGIPDSGGCVAPPGDVSLDAWGGDMRVSLDATGFFRTDVLCDRWWFITPDGHPTWSLGINTLGPYSSEGQETGRNYYAETVAAVYGSDEAWAEANIPRVRGWGFNTAGSWSADTLLMGGMAVTPILYVSGGDWLTGDVADWWDPAWEADVAAIVAAQVAPYVGNPGVLGWFLDNEMRWGPDWRGAETLLQLYLGLDASAPGKAAAVDYLIASLGSLDAVNATLGTAAQSRDELLGLTTWDTLGGAGGHDDLISGFVSLAAERYFSVVVPAVRAVDPDHLILGNREVSVMTPLEVYAAADPYLDVFGINTYTYMDGLADAALILSGGVDPADGFAALHDAIDKPILISEFGFRAADSGLPNSWPPVYPTYDTQAERAAAYTDYAGFYQDVPWVVGWHWFAWVDQPAEGRFDGEDNNWGIITDQDVPYAELVAAMTTMNAQQAERVQLSR